MELIFCNPAQLVTSPGTKEPEVQPPSVSTVNSILADSIEHDDDLCPAIHLIAYSGIRRGECLGLHWQPVDFNRQAMSIINSLVRSAEKGVIFEPPKSTVSRRIVNLDDGTMAVIRAHKVRQMEHRLTMARSYRDNDLVLPDEFGQPLNPMKLTRALDRAGKRVIVGLVKLTI